MVQLDLEEKEAKTGAATIDIDITETGEPDTESMVTNVGTNENVILNFKIPRGKQGDIGPQGPKGEPNGLGAYGERYSNSNQGFSVTANTETIVPLEQTGQAIFIEYGSSYAIEIQKYGTYQINYFFGATTSVDTNYTISIKASGIKLPASEIKVEAKANAKSFVSGNVIFGLKEDDEVTLVITADNNTNLTFDGSTNAKLSVLKLD